MAQTEKDMYLDTFTKFSRAHTSVMNYLSGPPALPEDMTITQFGVLEVLLHKGPLTHREIAAKILKSRGNLTMVIDHLERDGLVERLPVAGDRRSRRVALTPRGEKRIKTVFPLQVEAIRSVFGNLDDQEVILLGQLCRKLGLSLATENRSKKAEGEKPETASGGAQ
ncbi:MarR family transcriptional regulator [Marispirochaeta aestuarii]|uniref:MarR family winged helix-turn-helix transcriptional regulator n=1 Tax=Marispirochaeta aestuarii TaxID=1963862 RepID=UPI0029C66154|nr:MarR family transcriptional regulator [Marispirochaeta aestuarii]